MKKMPVIILVAIVGSIATFLPWVHLEVIFNEENELTREIMLSTINDLKELEPSGEILLIHELIEKGQVYLHGTKGDGWISFALFLMIILLSLLRLSKGTLKGGVFVIVIILSLFAAFVGISKFFQDPISIPIIDDMSVSISYGPYIVAIAGLLIPLAGFMIKGKPKALPI